MCIYNLSDVNILKCWKSHTPPCTLLLQGLKQDHMPSESVGRVTLKVLGFNMIDRAVLAKD